MPSPNTLKFIDKLEKEASVSSISDLERGAKRAESIQKLATKIAIYVGSLGLVILVYLMLTGTKDETLIGIAYVAWVVVTYGAMKVALNARLAKKIAKNALKVR